MVRFPGPNYLVFAALVLFGASCSQTETDKSRQPVFPVTGKVLVQGKPATEALVVFHPAESTSAEELRPNGRVSADGSFVIGTYADGDGAPVGEYSVTITWPKPPAGPMPDPDLAPDRLQGRYNNPHKPAFRTRVEPRENQLQPFVIR